MEKQEILKMIQEAFDNHISSSATETLLGLESRIEGKDEFFKEIKDRLIDMFIHWLMKMMVQL